MNPISGTSPTQMSNSQGSDPMMEKAKSMGVPDEIIAKGIKSGGSLSEELGKSDIGHDELLKALDGGAETTKQLFEEKNFSINIGA